MAMIVVYFISVNFPICFPGSREMGIRVPPLRYILENILAPHITCMDRLKLFSTVEMYKVADALRHPPSRSRAILPYSRFSAGTRKTEPDSIVIRVAKTQTSNELSRAGKLSLSVGKDVQSFRRWQDFPDRAIDECMVRANEVWGNKPIHRIFRNLSPENDDAEALTELIFVGFDTYDSIPNGHALLLRSIQIRKLLQLIRLNLKTQRRWTINYLMAARVIMTSFNRESGLSTNYWSRLVDEH